MFSPPMQVMSGKKDKWVISHPYCIRDGVRYTNHKTRSAQNKSAFYFFEFLFVVGSNGSHPSVPEKKIQTIISFEVLVVLVVIDGCIDPSSQPMTAEIPGI